MSDSVDSPLRRERLLPVPGAELCVETFGRAGDPAVLLMMGATASMVWWPDELCSALAARGRLVIRYDQRDTGRSTSYPPGQPGYTVDDLAGDALGVLDALAVPSATLVGMSLGGFLAQLVALRAPERVRALVLIASEPLGPGDPSLPGIDPEVLAYLARGADIDHDDIDALVEHSVGGWRLLAGPARPFDEPLVREQARRHWQRARDRRSSANHALLTGGDAWFDRLGEIRQPTVVIHGTHDRVLPYGHGQALASNIPGARLLTLEGVGHELHRIDFPTITEAIVDIAP
jgi:pimeloyl-ACP methyl ester carboxylesterase